MNVAREFEQLPRESGQLEAVEAALLYATIRERAPSVVIEVGTDTGAGTTFYIAQALHANGCGQLHSIEIDAGRHAVAFAKYTSDPRVRFYCGAALDVLPELPAPDVLMIDGGSGEQPRQEIELMEPRMATGSAVIVHDWYAGKVEAARGYLEKSDQWQLVIAVGAPGTRVTGLAVWNRA